MSKLTLGDLRDHVGDYLTGLEAAVVARNANMVLRDMGRHVGPIKRSTFTTTPPKTTGTVAINQDSKTVTGTGTAFASTDVEALAQLNATGEWFSVDSFSSATSLEISSKWPDANITGKAFEIVYPRVSLGTDVLQVLKIGQAGLDDLKRVEDERVLHLANNMDTGKPEFWWQDTYGNDGAYRIRLARIPDARYTFVVTYRKTPALYDPRSDKTAPDYPDIYDDAIFCGTMHYLFLKEDSETKSAFWWQKFQTALKNIRDTRLEGLYLQMPVPSFRAQHSRLTHNLPVS